MEAIIDQENKIKKEKNKMNNNMFRSMWGFLCIQISCVMKPHSSKGIGGGGVMKFDTSVCSVQIKI